MKILPTDLLQNLKNRAKSDDKYKDIVMLFDLPLQKEKINKAKELLKNYSEEDISEMIRINVFIYLALENIDEKNLIELAKKDSRILDMLEDESFRTYIKLAAGV